MPSTSPDWLRNGTGMAPRIAWAFSTDAELASLSMARETGELFAVDQSGGLYQLNRTGRIGCVSRGLKNARLLRWSDNGEAGVALCGDDEFCLLDKRLNVLWSADTPAKILTAAIDAWGHNIALALDNGDNVLLSVDREKLGQFTTLQPLKFLQFSVGKPRLFGAAEYGLLCCHGFTGKEVFAEKLWSTVGDLSVTEDGKQIFLASHAHGVQQFDRHGTSQASYIVEGTPNRVSASFFGERVVASTIERHLYWLDADGALLWAAETPEPVVNLICDPLGEWLIVGFQSGRVLRLDWESDR